MPLTDAKIRSLRLAKERYIHWEKGSTGLGVRVSPQGRKTFIFMYRFDGKSRMMSVGPYYKTSLATARKMVADAKEKMTEGVDPGRVWTEDKKQERESDTVEELAEEYLEKWARPRKKSAKEDERILRVDVLPRIGKRKAKSITRRDVIKLLDGIVDRGAPIAANRTLAVIRKMFNFALSRDIVDATPCAAITAPSKENKKDRVLNEAEIKAFWDGLEKCKMSEGSKLTLKLQLVTAARKGEVLTAEWSEFDLNEKVWNLPAEKSKNNLAHRVPLSPQALEIIKQIKEQSGKSRWLFPTPISKDSHVTLQSTNHALKRNIKILNIVPFTPHDLRRTAASQMTSMGIPRLVVSKILNHAESGVTAIYDRHSYDKEKRQALETWGRKVESIITGKKAKVIEFRK